MTRLTLLSAATAAMMAIAIGAAGCNSPTAASHQHQRAIVQIDTVAVSQIIADSTRDYLDVEVKWGFTLDTARADSLANWFAQSGFRILDMWFPASGPACLRPYQTLNYVFVRLEQPDSLIDTLGFTPSTYPGGCFPTWRQYSFSWPLGGT